MNSRGPAPNPDSLRGRIRGFFEMNPDEFLTWDDMCTKFDCTKEQAVNAIKAIRSRGRLEFEVISVVRVVRQ